MTPPTLSLTNVTLTYPDGDDRLTALDSVEMHVDAGEFVAVIGPSGSGKSSLLAAAGALLTPDSGSISIEGEEITAVGQANRARTRADKVGFVFQGTNLLSSLKAVDQLLVAVHLRGGDLKEARPRAVQLLTELGLGDKLDKRPGQLSGGERQRVGIARALISRPALLLVDEPTSALDHERGAKIIELLADLTTHHRVATLLVTHDSSQLEATDRHYEMRDGRLSLASDQPSRKPVSAAPG